MYLHIMHPKYAFYLNTIRCSQCCPPGGDTLYSVLILLAISKMTCIYYFYRRMYMYLCTYTTHPLTAIHTLRHEKLIVINHSLPFQSVQYPVEQDASVKVGSARLEPNKSR